MKAGRISGKRVTLKVKKLGKRTHMRSKPHKSTRKSTSRKSRRKSTSRKRSSLRKSKKSTNKRKRKRSRQTKKRGGRPIEEREDISDEETDTDSDEENIEEESYVMSPREGARDPMEEILNEPQSEMDRDIENFLQAEHFLRDLYAAPRSDSESDTTTRQERLNAMFPQVPTHTPVIREPLEDLPMVPGVEMPDPDDVPSMSEIRRRLAALRPEPDEPVDPDPDPLPSYEEVQNPNTGEELPSYDDVMNN